MKSTLKVGQRASISIDVTDEMRPQFDGVVIHPLYSTWSMAHHMEIVARRVLAEHLEEDEEGIGTHLSIDHVSPAHVGSKVTIEAEAIEVDERSLVCEVIARVGDRVVGRGRQVQRVLSRHRMDELIEGASP